MWKKIILRNTEALCYSCREEVNTMAGDTKKKNNWIADKLDRINLTVPKGKKDEIKAHAERQGESVNGFINRAIDQTIEQDQKDWYQRRESFVGFQKVTPKVTPQSKNIRLKQI